MVATAFAPRKRGALEVALHCTQTHPNVLRDGRGRPPLAVQGPDLRMERLPTGLALHGALLRREGDVMGWHRHGHRPIRQGYGLLVHQHIDRVECLAVRAEHLVQRFPEILQQMKTVRDLGGRRRPVPCAVGIGGRPIPRDDLHPGVLPEPLGYGLGGALREQGHGLAALEIDQDRAVGVPFAQGEIVDAQHPWAWETTGQAAGAARAAGCSGSRPGPTAWPRRIPAFPPSAMPRATRRWASRRVRRAQGAATVGSRSVKIRR